MPENGRLRRLPAAVQVGLVAAVYWGTAELALTFPTLPGNINPVWPPAGVALAAVVLIGPRVWPGVLVGEVLANLFDVPLAALVGMGTGNALAAVVAGLLLRRVGFRPVLDRPVDVVSLVVFGAALSTVVSATVGVTSLALAGVLPWSAFADSWRFWWLGDALGEVVVAPALLVFLRPGGPVPRPSKEWLATVAVTAVLAHVAFSGHFPFSFVIFPAIVWASARCFLPGATATTLIVSTVAVFHTAQGTGPFAVAREPAAESLWTLATFLVMVAATAMLLGAYAGELRRVQRALEASTRSLELRVALRTAELNADRQRLNEAQAIAHIGSWEWDAGEDVITWSEELYRIFGVDPADFPATYESYLERVHPDDRERVAATVSGALAGAQPTYEIEHRVVRPDGVRWVHSQGAAVTDDAGVVVRLRGTCQDVTGTFEAQAARMESDARFRTIVEAAQEGVWTLGPDDRTTFVNQRMAEMLGYRPEDMLGRSVFEFVPEADHELAAERLERRRQGIAEHFEAGFLGAEGRIVWGLISAAPLPAPPDQYNGVIAMVADITERRRLEAELAHQAHHDALTRLPNRLLLSDRIRAALAAAQDRSGRVAVLFLDVDRFKWINDSLGHETGDRILQEISQRLVQFVRPSDTVARLGGDEFVVLCELVDGIDAAMAIADRLLAAFDEPFVVDGAHLRLAASLGVAVGGEGDDPGRLIQDADSAMYQAKARGRGRAEAFDEANRREIQHRFEVASGLRRALDTDELAVQYQPIVDLASDRVVGVEALVRWNHPERGLLAPPEFIPIAEETGLVRAIGTLVLERAASVVAGWNARHPDAPPLGVAVNLSAAQLASAELVGVVKRCLTRTRLQPHLLHLEITESVLMADATSSAASLHALHDLGVRLVVDDFGTGYSSLLYLRRFPVDTLKVDRSFVDGLTTNPEDAAIVSAVIGLARSLNLLVVAEGVETSEQLERLRTLGCDRAQGFRWTPPLDAAALERWLEEVLAAGVARTRPPPRRVLVVDDQADFRTVLRLALEFEGGFEVVAEAPTGSEAIELARLHRPDLVLLDLVMPGVSGRAAIEGIRRAVPGTAVVVVSATERSAGIDGCLEAGALAYFEKGDDPGRLAAELAELVR